MFKIAVLASGGGTTFDNLAKCCIEGDLLNQIKIEYLATDRLCKALDIADKWNISKRTMRKQDFTFTEEWSISLLDRDINLYVLAGFLSHIVVPDYATNKILNIHPSLLPKYGGKGMYGINVHRAVISNKEKMTGCTVHIVNNEYDQGQILEQSTVEIDTFDDEMSIENKVKQLESTIYPKSILNYLRSMK